MIAGIDIGLKNLAWCTVEGEDINFGLIDLRQGKCKDYTKLVVDRYPFPFSGAQKIVIERQMNAKMKLIAQAVRLLHYKQSEMVTPHRIKKFYGTSTGKYKGNKKAAELKVSEIFPKIWKRIKGRKKDDICDAILMAFWGKSQSQLEDLPRSAGARSGAPSES